MEEPRIGDRRTDETGVEWIYAGKAGWQRIVNGEKQVSNRFDVEQGILSCWHVTGDIDLLYKQVMNGKPTTDEIANALLGIKSLYDMRFNALFDDFENSIGNDWMKEQNLKRQLDAKQAQIDELMLEYCPDEMTDEQWEEYQRHQRVVYDGRDKINKPSEENKLP